MSRLVEDLQGDAFAVPGITPQALIRSAQLKSQVSKKHGIILNASLYPDVSLDEQNQDRVLENIFEPSVVKCHIQHNCTLYLQLHRKILTILELGFHRILK